MELILASIFPSIAAIAIYAMKLSSKKSKPPKPYVHEHIWEPWSEHEQRKKYDYHRRQEEDILIYKRSCIDCGAPEYTWKILDEFERKSQ